MNIKQLIQNSFTVLAIASALLMCGWLLAPNGVESGEPKITAQGQGSTVTAFVKMDDTSQAQPRALSQAQQFLHAKQSMPPAILLFVFALLCVSCIPYLAALFLSLIPWYCRNQSLAKLRFSLWRDNNILKRHTSHSLTL
ncbi:MULTISPECIES: hypothetical protein [Pseudoalteromonas]|uniref:Uncharacterized protein n=1 Tax=Pseudoalteromonas amylolytica TaxID=1859457 RepID=A0A1S1MKK4_9GAMM|nr:MULTISPECIES: hypothetical protein [Pseudoalteromonas]OHU84259.1 hypothetical protein BFC16_01010 [Pseudoalteromonas sp. JW3]OHU87200.1 hypothetical protein BET10_00925 [Pseudoalteromonas amylolytica]